MSTFRYPVYIFTPAVRLKGFPQRRSRRVAHNDEELIAAIREGIDVGVPAGEVLISTLPKPFSAYKRKLPRFSFEKRRKTKKSSPQ